MFTLCFEENRRPLGSDLCLVVNDKQEILTLASGELPQMAEREQPGYPGGDPAGILSGGGRTGAVFLGTYGGRGVWLADTGLDQAGIGDGTSYISMPLRAFLASHGPDVQEGCLRALHVRSWLSRFRHCPECGVRLLQASREMALTCPSCQSTWYPTISPAMIVAVTRNEGCEILLAKPKGRAHNWYSLIAGFCEAGESVERTVEREVQEEVGITVKNLHYAGSQNWAFSQSLMIGFIAEYASGTVRPDPGELEEAGWFPLADLPPIPPPPSIANRLIRSLQESYQNSR